MSSLLKQAQENISEGKYYEGLQFYKSLYNRFTKSNQHDKAIKVVMRAASTMLEYNQISLAAELAKMLIQTYIKTKSPVNKENTDKLFKIISKFPDKEDGRFNRLAVLHKAIDWSNTKELEIDSDSVTRLHLDMARTYQNDGKFDSSMQQYLKTHEMKEAALMLQDWAQQGYHEERDLFIVRPVLSLLKESKIGDAKSLFENYMEQNRELDTPLIHYIKFTLISVHRRSYSLFKKLRTEYRTALNRDSHLSTLLDGIEKNVFNIQQQGGLNNLFGSLMSSFMGSGRS